MTLRFTPTIAICSVAAGITAAALAVPDPNPAEDPSASVYSSVGADAATATTLSSGEASQEDSAAPAAAPAQIEIADFAFGGQLVVKAGQTIDITNLDTAQHTLLADNGAFDTGVIDGGGSTQLVAPATAGAYSFICQIHPSMTAELIVEP